MSVMTKSGLCALVLRSRSSASAATPTTSNPACSRTRTIPSRTSNWSSPTTTRTATPTTLPPRDIPMVGAPATVHPVRMPAAITPETPLEGALLADPRLRAGLEWGAPRPGHPEGRVADHVAAILAGIAPDDPRRNDLRLLALVHDSFKAE